MKWDIVKKKLEQELHVRLATIEIDGMIIKLSLDRR